MLQGGDRFQYQSVVDRYHLRPEYPPAIYEQLLSFLEPTSAVLDVGCGPGKLSYPLSEVAERVDAVDLSAAMIELARADSRDDTRIHWIVGDAHTVDLGTDYDLIVAGSSIHWMNWDELFPLLAPLSSDRGVVAFLEGDGAKDQPWGNAELEAMKATQIAINDERPAWVDRARFPEPVKRALVRHPWFDRQDSLLVTHRVQRSVEDYIEINFSRQSFALDAMTEAAANRYRRDLRDILAEHAIDGTLTYDVRSIMEWGRLRPPG